MIGIFIMVVQLQMVGLLLTIVLCVQSYPEEEEEEDEDDDVTIHSVLLSWMYTPIYIHHLGLFTSSLYRYFPHLILYSDNISYLHLPSICKYSQSDDKFYAVS